MIELRGRRKRKSENMLCSCCQPSTQTGIQSELRSILKTSNPAVTAVCYEQDIWTWDGAQVPSCCRLYGDDDKTVLFHDKVANGTAAVRGKKKLRRDTISYWEVNVSHRLFGTAVMFGIGTVDTPVHRDRQFVNMLGGEDFHSCGLSHKGYVWQKAVSVPFCEPFPENTPTTIGLLFDGPSATLRYFKDGLDLGVGFSNIFDKFEGPFYPMISCTAAKIEMTLGLQLKVYMLETLVDWAAHALTNSIDDTTQIASLPLPKQLKDAIMLRCGST